MGSTDTFDLIVIGCGPSGEKAGAQAAYFRKRIAVLERALHMGDGHGNLAGHKLREG